MTRHTRNRLDSEHALGRYTFVGVEPIGYGALANAQFRGKGNLPAGVLDRFTQCIKSVHTPVYNTESNNAASTQSDIVPHDTRRVPKDAGISELWRRFTEGVKDLTPPKAIDQETLATKMGVVQGTISNWKRGEKKPPIDRGIALAEYAGLCVEYLYTGKGPRRPWGDVGRPLAKLVDVWEELTPAQRDDLLQYAEFLRGRKNAESPAGTTPSKNVTPIRKSGQKPHS